MEKIVEPLYAGIFAGDVYQLSAKAVLPRLVETESTHGSLIRGATGTKTIPPNSDKATRSQLPTFVTLKGGLIQLVDGIVSRLNGTSIMLNTKVLGVSTSDARDRNTFEILVKGADKVEADVVVLATPAYFTSKMVWQLDDRIASLLDTIPYVSTATVSLAFDKSEVGEKVKGHGFLVPRPEGELVTGCTWESSKWPGHAPPEVVLARCYLVWSGHEEFAELDDAALIERVRDFLRRVAEISTQPFFTRIFRWDNALPQYTVGHLERMPLLGQLLNGHRGLLLTDAAFHGVGLPDCIHDGYLTAEMVVKAVEERKTQ